MKDEDVVPKWLEPNPGNKSGDLRESLAKAHVYDYVRGIAQSMGYPDVCSALQDLTRLQQEPQRDREQDAVRLNYLLDHEAYVAVLGFGCVVIRHMGDDDFEMLGPAARTTREAIDEAIAKETRNEGESN